MNSKILLLSVAVIAVGLFAMPSTLSLFSGQHTFVAGENVSCSKCHSDIYTEISGVSNEVHNDGNFTACKGCHKTGNTVNIPVNGTNLTGTYDNNITVDANVHAAITLECVTCHSGVTQEITGSEEAHRPYYNASHEDNQSVIQLKGANTACIGCHTHVTVNMTWTRLTSFNITSNASSGAWVVSIGNNATDNLSTTYTNKTY